MDIRLFLFRYCFRIRQNSRPGLFIMTRQSRLLYDMPLHCGKQIALFSGWRQINTAIQSKYIKLVDMRPAQRGLWPPVLVFSITAPLYRAPQRAYLPAVGNTSGDDRHGGDIPDDPVVIRRDGMPHIVHDYRKRDGVFAQAV